MKKFITLIILTCCCATAFAQQEEQEEQKYRRSSLYSILLSHEQTKYSKEIEDVFSQIPIPDRFDNHDLSVKIITTDSKKKTDESIVNEFLEKNHIARRMVARWFDRDPKTGECDMNLIMHRGLYDASYFDVELAKMSQRGFGILADAGEDLINNTFVVVNDIRYRDKSESAKTWGAIMSIIGSVAGAASGMSGLSDLGKTLGSIVSEIKGFSVIVTSYLYRLEWNDDIARDFYVNCYVSAGENDQMKKAAFDRSQAFNLKYIGMQSISSGKTSMQGVGYDPIAMIRKVCTRSIDKSLVELQRNYDEFKIKTPIFSVSPTITAKVGLKEGITDKNKYEVLEQVVDNNGKTSYHRVGVIQPVSGRIWDNRYMAAEEKATNSQLEATTFRKLSGGDFYPGMLIREIK